eukprot:TRINITY_DN42813_c0_g1_i1.p1 TRINITY_DN42813_c0_g1~~TRINITY_DN42813_c0_g1_i1.p1  ORF type:complete len:125 (+),score=24.20 TRINITY_DN42813_c0_g1_i1:61-435(+)
MARRGTLMLFALASAALWHSFVPAFVGSSPCSALSRVALRAEAPADKKEKAPWIGPKKGAWVKILRPESYWFQQRGTVVNVNQKPEVKYPVTVKFQSVNYANVNTNGYALWEVQEAVAPGPGEL